MREFRLADARWHIFVTYVRLYLWRVGKTSKACTVQCTLRYTLKTCTQKSHKIVLFENEKLQ